ncbi:ATP-binding protein [Microvirga sp. G4-2]|uniref:ATP-binding protein n=1 Tax=Microvirga sp. G4-2 TaxID=3434467 RepID=UPI0040445CB8
MRSWSGTAPLRRCLAALLLVGCWLAISPITAHAETNPSGQGSDTFFLGPSVDHLLDPTGALGIDDLAKRDDLFTRADGHTPNRGVSPSPQAAFWLRVHVPALATDRDWVLSLDETRIVRAILYRQGSEGWVSQEWSLRHQGAADRSSLSYPNFRLRGEDIADQVLHLRIETTSSMRAMLWLESEHAFLEGHDQQTFASGILVGVLMGLLVYLLAIGLALLDGSLLRLSILVLIFVVYFISDRALLETLVVPGAFGLSRAVSLSSSLLIFPAWLWFEIHYLKLRTYLPRAATAGTIIALAVAACAIEATIENILGIRVMRLYSSYIGLGSLAFGLGLAVLAVRYKRRDALIFILSWSPAIIGGFARLSLDAFPKLGPTRLLANAVYFGVALSLFVFGIMTSLDLQARERRLRAKAEASESRFRSFADSASDTFWETDRAGRIISITGSSGDVADLKVGAELSARLQAHSVEAERPSATLLGEYLAQRRPFRSVLLSLRATSGALHYASFSGTPVIGENGEYLGHRGVLSDVTEETVLRERQIQQQKMAALGQLAGGIAHEINNLLHPILNLSRRVREHLYGQDELYYQMGLVVDATMQAREIVANVLTSARPSLQASPTLPFREALVRSIESVHPLLPASVTLQVDLCGDKGLSVPAGEVLQIVSNLISNAVHAVHGAGTITITTTMDKETRALILSIADDGEGMDAETRRKALEPFFTTKAPSGGTGLGLPLVYGIVSGWGASIDIVSERGQGTTIAIRIPPTLQAKETRHGRS